MNSVLLPGGPHSLALLEPSLQQVKQDAAGLQVSLTGVRCDIAE
jgi:hypothetical protein